VSECVRVCVRVRVRVCVYNRGRGEGVGEPEGGGRLVSSYVFSSGQGNLVYF